MNLTKLGQNIGATRPSRLRISSKIRPDGPVANPRWMVANPFHGELNPE